MNKKNNHNHRSVLLALFALNAVLLAAVVVLGAEAYQYWLEVDAIKTEVAADRAKEGAFVKLKQLSTKTTEHYDTLTGFVVTRDSLVGFINSAEGAAASAGATTSVVAVDETGFTDKKTKKHTLTGWQLTLRLAGSFAEVWQGTQAVEALPMAMKVTKISLSKTADQWTGDIIIEAPTIK